MEIRIKRVYDSPSPDDGLRVLVDRLWPRGVKKADAAVDVWAKDLAPSSELRKWFNHDGNRFEEFAHRYRDELDSANVSLEPIMTAADHDVVTLLYAARNPTCNHALVLQNWLQPG
jgi:uncharacterized protein YeaO (DUF488 family)